MKITKFVHSCLLVEMAGRTAIFDPGAMSFEAFDMDRLERLDDIFITHIHQDHYHLPFIKALVDKFPGARITATEEVVASLTEENIKGQKEAPDGVVFFDSPHESVEPLFPAPQEIGIHYLDILSHPGDSHSFKETKAVLALPITAPWGSAIKALNLALQLKPRYVIPIHDWHWREEAQAQMYDGFKQVLSKEDITFFKPETGQPIEIQAD